MYVGVVNDKQSYSNAIDATKRLPMVILCSLCDAIGRNRLVNQLPTGCSGELVMQAAVWRLQGQFYQSSHIVTPTKSPSSCLHGVPATPPTNPQ